MATTTTKRKKSFSHSILQKEYHLLVFINVSAVLLAFYSIHNAMDASLPWIATMSSCSWAAWGASKVAYSSKSAKENTRGGIVYETTVNNDVAS